MNTRIIGLGEYAKSAKKKLLPRGIEADFVFFPLNEAAEVGKSIVPSRGWFHSLFSFYVWISSLLLEM